MTRKKIIVAPLNWGLGHATRCVPIINALIEHDFIPVIASDGYALELLQKEFPKLAHLELPSYNIKYKKNLKWGLILQLPVILKSVRAERQIIADYIRENKVSGVISDNRFGVRSKEVPTVYITHQLNVLSGSSTFITSIFHRHIIKKFRQCWVPDNLNGPRLSGELSALKNTQLKLKFVGALSRFNNPYFIKKYDLLILLSGPEPHRSTFEEKLLSQLETFNKRVLLVRGVISEDKRSVRHPNITLVNFMLTNELEEAINQSELVLARSGYSTILDLAKLKKRAFFVPTPGQFEQEYLARRMKELRIAPFESQGAFHLKMLSKIQDFKGFIDMQSKPIDPDLFKLFEGE